MATKIILTQEVTGLGSAGDIVEVKDGYDWPAYVQKLTALANRF